MSEHIGPSEQLREAARVFLRGLNGKGMNEDQLAGFIVSVEPLVAVESAVQRLKRDIAQGAKTLSDQEARFLVDAYYQMQGDRIRAGNQSRALNKSNEPVTILSWLGDQRYTLEKQVASTLNIYSASKPQGEWARSITGIGPILSAGLIAHIDVRRQPTVGHLWSFAGLNPEAKWSSDEVRPWNGALKRLCWLIGESFVKVSSNDDDVYGHVYAARKLLEIERNEQHLFADQAAAALKAKRFSKDTVAKKFYEQGMLPPAHIHARAKRYAVKLFLAHFHCVAHWLQFRTLPPKPYVISHLEHVHYIAPPNSDTVYGLDRAIANYEASTKPQARATPHASTKPTARATPEAGTKKAARATSDASTKTQARAKSQASTKVNARATGKASAKTPARAKLGASTRKGARPRKR